MATPAEPASDRVRLRRGAIRAEYDRAAIFEVLDAGLIAHVGVVTDAGPIVLPMAYGRTDDWLYVHGSVANAALRAAVGQDICITVTIVDGMVVGRCPFHNSMNYRGVVVRGVARRVDDPDEHVAALRLVSDHVMPTWDTAREPNATEIRQTMVVAVPLVEMSAKIRGGDPIDEPEDVDGPHWAGHVPIRSVWESPVDAADLPDGDRRRRTRSPAWPGSRCDASQPGRSVGRPPRRPGARPAHRQPRLPRRRRSPGRPPPQELDAVDHVPAAVQGLAPSARPAARLDAAVLPRRRRRARPPATARARRAGGPTTSPTATRSTAMARARRRGSSTAA